MRKMNKSGESGFGLEGSERNGGVKRVNEERRKR